MIDGSGSRHGLADDLESLLSGTLSVPQFRSKYKAFNPDLPDILGNVDHYLDDADIRQREPDYCAMQIAEMKKLVRLLRAGAPDNELQRINFLQGS